MQPETRYARSGDVNIAYQVVGAAPLELVYVPGWVSNVEYGWEEPSLSQFLGRLAKFSRLILFDKRETGLSDRVTELPALEQRMDDVRAVMDAVGSRRAALFGTSEGGPMCAFFAATYPERTAVDADRVVTTNMVTDIVGSTEHAVTLGDRRWRELLAEHDATVRRELVRHRGVEQKTTGDGFLATFDGPARAIRCACAIRAAMQRIGIDLRIGLHTGGCPFHGGDVSGIALHIGARVADRSGTNEVLVTSTVKDLVAGSGIAFEDRGRHTLKGVPGVWRLYVVAR